MAPLERKLMMKFGLVYADARAITAECREKLGLSKYSPWSQELEDECMLACEKRNFGINHETKKEQVCDPPNFRECASEEFSNIKGSHRTQKDRAIPAGPPPNCRECASEEFSNIQGSHRTQKDRVIPAAPPLNFAQSAPVARQQQKAPETRGAARKASDESLDLGDLMLGHTKDKKEKKKAETETKKVDNQSHHRTTDGQEQNRHDAGDAYRHKHHHEDDYRHHEEIRADPPLEFAQPAPVARQKQKAPETRGAARMASDESLDLGDLMLGHTNDKKEKKTTETKKVENHHHHHTKDDQEKNHHNVDDDRKHKHHSGDDEHRHHHKEHKHKEHHGHHGNARGKLERRNTEKKSVKKFSEGTFTDNYELGTVLGRGAFATVHEVKSRKTGKLYAAKIITHEKLSAHEKERLKAEIEFMTEMDHPNVVSLLDFFSTDSAKYLVMEKMEGGELFDRIVMREYYNEKEARDFCIILLRGMYHIHSKNVAHRDLKPENLLLVSRDNDHEIKIADFGLAKRALEPDVLTTFCGSPNYVAPEILLGQRYGKACDMWSIGVILYIVLGGYAPFEEDNTEEQNKRIVSGDYVFEEEYWEAVSHNAKALISELLVVEPSQRKTAKEAIVHDWIHATEEELADNDLMGSLSSFKHFNAKRKMKAATKAIMASRRLSTLRLAGNLANLGLGSGSDSD